MSTKETAEVVKGDTSLQLRTGNGTYGWPKKLRPQNAEEYVGKQLEITRTGGVVESVRSQDPAWELPEPQPKVKGGGRDQHPHQAPGHGQGRGQRQERGPGQERRHQSKETPSSRTFVNPYNFIPFAGDPRDNPEGLAPASPVGHDRLLDGHFTGILDITLTTDTPLLLVDQSRARLHAGHKTLPCMVGQDGKPRLPASAVRGMLRSAYEAVTNSAFGVFDRRWDKPLAMRNPATSALGMCLARVSDDGKSLELQPQLLPKESNWRQRGEHPLLIDPWMPMSESQEHGQVKEEVTLTLWYHERGRFYFWRGPGATPGRSAPVKINGALVRRKVKGVVFATGKTIRMKHDDRLFITEILDDTSGDQGCRKTEKTELTEDLRTSWRSVLDSYLAAAQERKEVKDSDLPYVRYYENWVKLAPGQLVFAKTENGQVSLLSPSMIGRTPFKVPPADLTMGHRPPTALNELTPADRVFGWVQGTAAYAGQLTIEPPVCKDAQWQGRDTSTPLELATLGSPKPAYYRFYVTGGDDEDKSPERGFTLHESLRGWKTYVHHKQMPENVEDHVRVRTYGTGKENEDAQPSKQVTLSVENWVKPGVEFTCRLRVTNLSPLEFGALLWLLDGRFRVGLAKPLGFGTVSSAIQAWTPLEPAARYLGGSPGSLPWQNLARDFEAAWQGREHLNAYREAMHGWSEPEVSYPKVEKVGGQTPNGQPGYEWFVKNEAGQRYWLPALGGAQAPTLPWYRAELAGIKDMPRGVARARTPKPARGPQKTSRGAPQGKRLSGKVKFFNVARGFGFIAGEDGKDYHFRASDSDEGSRHTGRRVTFSPTRGHKGEAAKDVKEAR